mmetsp:Transcript_54038/g.143842  ORF Transcript_54038/g.143842 Transcript_54038/m.143842 type:complete len:215 (-) Transcript_54038:319-963(-)
MHCARRESSEPPHRSRSPGHSVDLPARGAGCRRRLASSTASGQHPAWKRCCLCGGQPGAGVHQPQALFDHAAHATPGGGHPPAGKDVAAFVWRPCRVCCFVRRRGAASREVGPTANPVVQPWIQGGEKHLAGAASSGQVFGIAWHAQCAQSISRRVGGSQASRRKCGSEASPHPPGRVRPGDAEWPHPFGAAWPRFFQIRAVSSWWKDHPAGRR